MITLVAVLVVLAVSMWPVDGLRVTPLRKPPREAEAVTLLAELTALGLSAGHSFAQALGEASARVPGSLGDQARSVLREARNAGLAVALQRVSGDAGRALSGCGTSLADRRPSWTVGASSYP